MGFKGSLRWSTRDGASRSRIGSFIFCYGTLIIIHEILGTVDSDTQWRVPLGCSLQGSRMDLGFGFLQVLLFVKGSFRGSIRDSQLRV